MKAAAGSIEGAAMKNAVAFLNSVRRHWVALITSGSIIAVLAIWQGTGHAVWPWVYWLVAIGGFGFACFQSWGDQENRISKLEGVVKEHQDKRLNIRKAVYSQLAYHYGYIRNVLSEEPKTHEEQDIYAQLIGGIDVTAYKWAKTQADVFSQLPEALDLDALYLMIQRIRTHCSERMGGKEGLAISRKFIMFLEEVVLSGDMEVELFRQINPAVYDAIIQKATS
jgi:hypothetical protein